MQTTLSTTHTPIPQPLFHNFLSGFLWQKLNNIPAQTPGFLISAKKTPEGFKPENRSENMEKNWRHRNECRYEYRESMIEFPGLHYIMQVLNHFNSMFWLLTWNRSLILISFRVIRRRPCVQYSGLHSYFFVCESFSLHNKLFSLLPSFLSICGSGTLSLFEIPKMTPCLELSAKLSSVSVSTPTQVSVLLPLCFFGTVSLSHIKFTLHSF